MIEKGGTHFQGRLRMQKGTALSEFDYSVNLRIFILRKSISEGKWESMERKAIQQLRVLIPLFIACLQALKVPFDTKND